MVRVWEWGIRNAEWGRRPPASPNCKRYPPGRSRLPLRDGVEPEAGGVRPGGKSEKRHRAKNPGPEDQAFNLGVISSDLRKNFIFMNFFIKGLAVYSQNL